MNLARGTITSWTCDPSKNGLLTPPDLNDDILGPSNHQLTQVTWSGGVAQWGHTNVWAGATLIATYDPTGLHFYLNDPLGTRRVQTDYAGVVEQSCASLPYGDGESCAPSPTEQLYTGKQLDAESGNYYFGARYYNPTVGHFLTPDWSAKVEPVPYSKLSDPQSLNLYSYVLNNPLTDSDPTGHASKETCSMHGRNCSGSQNDSDGTSGQKRSAQPSLPNAQTANKQAIKNENNEFKNCIRGNRNNAMVDAMVKSTLDTVHEAVTAARKASKELSASPPEPTQNAEGRVTAAITQAVIELHAQCLAKHPLAALSPNYHDFITPSDAALQQQEPWLKFAP